MQNTRVTVFPLTTTISELIIFMTCERLIMIINDKAKLLPAVNIAEPAFKQIARTRDRTLAYCMKTERGIELKASSENVRLHYCKPCY